MYAFLISWCDVWLPHCTSLEGTFQLSLATNDTFIGEQNEPHNEHNFSLSLHIYYVIIYYNNNFTNHFANTSKACGFMSVYAVLHPHLHKSRKPRKGYVCEQPQPI